MSSNKLHKLLFVVGAGLICSIVLASGHTKKPDQPIMPVLRDISEEAQAWYENLRPRPATPPDIQNPKVLAFTRKFMSGIYLANVEKLGINYELEPVDVDVVRHSGHYGRISSRAGTPFPSPVSNEGSFGAWCAQH